MSKETREIAERLIADAFGTKYDNPIHAVAGKTIVSLTDAIDKALRDRDERAAKIADEAIAYLENDHVKPNLFRMGLLGKDSVEKAIKRLGTIKKRSSQC